MNKKQVLYQNIIFGTLIYSVVLGFFNDYTNIVNTRSYSITFLTAFVLQLMIYPTFQLKGIIVNFFKGRQGKYYKIGMAVSVWLVMFFSKFIFLWMLDLFFGSALEISGFIGLILIILIATIIQRLILNFNEKLI